jgi:hypothetical protein
MKPNHRKRCIPKRSRDECVQDLAVQHHPEVRGGWVQLSEVRPPIGVVRHLQGRDRGFSKPSRRGRVVVMRPSPVPCDAPDVEGAAGPGQCVHQPVFRLAQLVRTPRAAITRPVVAFEAAPSPSAARPLPDPMPRRQRHVEKHRLRRVSPPRLNRGASRMHHDDSGYNNQPSPGFVASAGRLRPPGAVPPLRTRSPARRGRPRAAPGTARRTVPAGEAKYHRRKRRGPYLRST